jgi:hypothetical protein
MYADDVRRVIYLTIAGFLLVLVSWLGLIYVSSCGFTLNCYQALPLVVRTPVPTLIPISHSESANGESETIGEFNKCQVAATDLIGAWVTAGSPEIEPFPFTDTSGNSCEGTYDEEIQHLFVENSLWYPGALGCTSCHNAELTERSGGLDLSSYEGVMAGTNRSYEGAAGTDILGGGDWESSLLHNVLLVQGLVPEGHSPDVDPVAPVFLYAGQKAEETGATPTATP